MASFDIVVVSQLALWVRNCAGVFDTEESLTAMRKKGSETNHTCLACLAPFLMTYVRVNINGGDFLHWWAFLGLLFGGTLPYELVMLSNWSVENAGDQLLKERMVVRFWRGISLPAVVNWFTRRTTPIEGQEQHGSCWAFYFKVNGPLPMTTCRMHANGSSWILPRSISPSGSVVNEFAFNEKSGVGVTVSSLKRITSSNEIWIRRGVCDIIHHNLLDTSLARFVVPCTFLVQCCICSLQSSVLVPCTYLSHVCVW